MSRGTASRSGGTAFLLALLVASAGCDTVFSRAVTRTDSAGIAIVHSHRAAWPEDGGWSVYESPAYSLDGPGQGSAFLRIAGVALLEGGGVAVADAGDQTIHFFDGAGALIRSVRPGDAPVMQRSVTRVYRSGDEILVAQRGLQPTLVFDATGAFVRTIEPPEIEGFPFIAQYAPMDDGSLLAVQPPTGLIPRGEEWTENASFVRIAGGGGAERVAAVPAVRFKRLPSRVEPMVWGPVLGFAFAPDGVWAGFPDRFDIGFYGPDGELLRRIRRDWEPTAVSPASADSIRERLLSIMDEAGIPGEPEMREQPETQIRELAIAETLPAYGRILLDPAGRLWVEGVPPPPIVLSGPIATRPVPSPWDVFDANGEWLGTIDLPADTHLMDVGTDAVAGIVTAGQTPRVVVHRIETGPGQD